MRDVPGLATLGRALDLDPGNTNPVGAVDSVDNWDDFSVFEGCRDKLDDVDTVDICEYSGDRGGETYCLVE